MGGSSRDRSPKVGFAFLGFLFGAGNSNNGSGFWDTPNNPFHKGILGIQTTGPQTTN